VKEHVQESYDKAKEDVEKKKEEQRRKDEKDVLYPEGRQAVLDDAKEKWEENITQPLHEAHDKAKKEVEEEQAREKAKEDRNLLYAEGRQAAIDDASKYMKENVTDPMKEQWNKMYGEKETQEASKEGGGLFDTSDKGSGSNTTSKPSSTTSTTTDPNASVLKDISTFTKENVVEPAFKAYEQGKAYVDNTLNKQQDINEMNKQEEKKQQLKGDDLGVVTDKENKGSTAKANKASVDKENEPYIYGVRD
jgi:hypothetical protein